jgi:hypothetical protein
MVVRGLYCPLHNSVKSQIFVKTSRDLVPEPNNSPAKAGGKVLRTEEDLNGPRCGA